MRESGDVAFVERTIRTEVLLDDFPLGPDVDVSDQRLIAQPLVEQEPVLAALQGECVGRQRIHRAGARPAQQPALAVRQDSQANALACRLRLGQVFVQLLDVLWVRFIAAGRPDAALDFDKRVECGQVNGLSRPVGGRGSPRLSLHSSPGRLR